MMGLTIHEGQCLSVIRALTDGRGFAPSYSEIQAELGVSSRANVFRLVHSLAEKGFLRLKAQRGALRCIEIAGEPIPPWVFEELDPEALRKTIAIAAGILAQRTGGPEAQLVLDNIASKLPGAARRVA